MVQQLSDAELEIMKIVWGNPQEVTLFSYIMDGMASRGRPCQKNRSEEHTSELQSH